MKKVIINGKYLTQRQTGVQRYANEIVLELDKLTNKNGIVLAVPNIPNFNIPTLKNIRVVKLSPFSDVLWEQFTFPFYVIGNGGISLNLCNVAPLLSPGYCTIHDLKILSHPQFYGWEFRWWYRLLFANQTMRCKTILTVSEQVKNDIIYYYPSIDSGKIVVTPNSWQHFDRIDFDEQASAKYGLVKGNYYFAMGSLEPNKNFKWIAEVAKRNPKEMFAIAGSLNTKVFAKGLGFEFPMNMKLLGYVSDEEAKTLMRDAKAFLFPSFCEGFGMPPLEALSAGCSRVIVSDIPVMHEIFKDNAIYINPNQYDYDLDKLIANSRCDAKSVLSRFSWKESARIIYNTINNNNKL